MELIHLLKMLICIALIFVTSGILHEFGHLIMCLLLKCKVIEIKIWFLLIKIEQRSINVSVSLRGKEHCSFLSNSKLKMMAIMLCGPIVNLMLAISFLILLFVKGLEPIYVCGLIYNVILAVHELYPNSKGDGYMVCKAIKEIIKRHNEY